MAQVVEHLPNKCKALNSKFKNAKKKKNQKFYILHARMLYCVSICLIISAVIIKMT
jgi:hypothetical protein